MDNNTGVHLDNNIGVHDVDLSFTLVDFAKIVSFIMAYQVNQDFYMNDPSNKRW